MFLFFLTEKLLKTGPSLWDGLKPSHFHIHRQLVEYVDTLCTVKLSECFMCEDRSTLASVSAAKCDLLKATTR